MEKEYDVIVIGAGSAGLTSAVGFKKAGKSVLLVERAEMGGDCTNSGCIPSKSLLHHAKTFCSAKQVAGETADLAKYRSEAFTYTRNKIAEVLAEETPAHFEAIGIDVIKGEATFVDHQKIEVLGNVYTFKKAIIASGSRARKIEIPGLREDLTLTNENLFDLEEAPERLLVIGGGAIGLEMSQAMALLGTKVTMVVREAELGLREDPAVREVLQKTFLDLGITVLTESEVQKVEGKTAFVSTSNEASKEIDFDKVLVAVGRVVNLPEGLEAAHVSFTERGITINKNHRTTNKQVFAVGDVANRLKFTHTADDSARQVIAHVLSKGLVKVKDKPVPKVTYTEPEMAQVGLSEVEAIEEYGADKIYRIEVPFKDNDRAKTESSTNGVAVLIVKRLSGKILGAHIIGPRAGELLTICTLAMKEKISTYKLQSLIYAYPTYSLILKKAADQFFATQIGNAKSDLFGVVRRNAPKLSALLIWGIALWLLFRLQDAQNMSVLDTSLLIFDFVTNTIWGPLLYILIYAVRPLTFFPGTLLTVLSGVFFGLWGGILYTVIGANLSAALAYGVGRYFGASFKLERTPLRPLVEGMQKEPFLTTLTARLIFLPFDLVNYAGGILKLPFWSYLGATVIGTLLGIATFVSIGAALDIEELRRDGLGADIIDIEFIGLSVVIFILSIGVSKLLKRRKVQA